MFSRTIVLFLFFGLLFSMSASSVVYGDKPYAEKQYAEKSLAFRARLVEDLGTLDWNYGELNAEVAYQLMEGLFRSDQKGFPQPAVAESFRWNKDKTELRVKLREAARWSDSVPVCAQQFVDSWNRLRSKEFASPYAHYASVLKSFEADGCSRLVVRFQRPAPEAPALFAHYVFFPIRLDQLSGAPQAFQEGTSLVVNGPFRVKEWRKNVLLALERNSLYAGKKPALERVEFRFIPEDSTAKAMFELKELDWVKEVPQLVRTPELERSPDFRVFPSLIVYYFGLNSGKSDLLRDAGVRQALSAALDRSEIPKILGRECRGTTSWLLPELMPSWKPGKPGPVDPAAVERLQRAVKEKKLSLVLRTYSKTAHKVLAEWAQGQWEKKLGVRIPLEVQEGKVYWKEISINPAPIFFSGVTAPFGHPRAFLQEFLSGGSANWTGWHSAEYDGLVAAERFAEAEAVLERDGFVIPLYQRDTVALVGSRWKGFHINPLGQVFLGDVGLQ
jgi:ABC-type oligopeptide transport system substrate-binding subunit